MRIGYKITLNTCLIFFFIKCEARKCPALRQLAFGTIEPVDCVTIPQPYQRGCTMACVSGYTIKGDSNLQCGSDGNWVGTFPICEGILDLMYIWYGTSKVRKGLLRVM